MLSQSPVWAVLRATDVERAKKFYSDSVGLSEMKDMAMPGMGVFACGDGTGLIIYERPMSKAPETTVAGWNVKDLEAEMTTLRGTGVVFEEYDMPGIKTVNGVATMGPVKSAWFKDSEGNILAVNQM